ncbi:Twinfilin-1, partial [Pichia californica]
MSSQSGIVPSDELISEFHKFLKSGNRALILTIDSNNLTINISNLINGSNNLNNDLDSLISNNILNDKDCMYIILKYDENKFAFISYVPDNSIVRYKMLYASSKNTLLRLLNNEYFNLILFINNSNELSSLGWEKILLNLNSIPLSQDEINLKNSINLNIIKTKANSVILNDSANNNNNNSNNLLFNIDSNLVDILNDYNNKSSILINLKIDNEILKLSNKSEN